MIRRNLFIAAIIVLGISLLACNKDDDDHGVEIEFLEPMDEEVVSSPDDVHIHIKITGDEELHDIEIIMHPEGDENVMIIDQDDHSHENSYEFEEDYDLSSYPSGTEFHLTVRVAKDHEGNEFEEDDIHFSIP